VTQSQEAGRTIAFWAIKLTEQIRDIKTNYKNQLNSQGRIFLGILQRMKNVLGVLG
jgi:hypothetical protein